MGGLGGTALKGLLEHSGQGGAGEEAWKLGKEVWSWVGSKESVRDLHPHAAAVMDLDSAFIAQRNKAYKALEEPVQKLWNGISQDQQLSKTLTDRKLTMRDIHSQLSSTGHPLAQHSGQILSQNLHPKSGISLNADHTFETMGFQNKLQSNRMASDQVFGPHMQNIVPYIQDLYESSDPRDHSTANLLMDVISNDSHDTFRHGGTDKSRVKYEIRTAFGKENKLRKRFGGPQLDLPNTDPTYRKQEELERKWHGFLVNRLAALAALPHIPMFGNLMGSPMQDIVKGIASMGDQKIKDTAMAAGILSNTMHQMFYNDLMGRTGQAAKIIGQGPAAFFYKMFHMPMFDTVRMWQLSLASSVGYHSALDWASMAAQGSKIAVERLKELKLDPQAIIARGGKLSQDEIEQSMFHYVNNRMFVDRPMDRALYANSNPYFRSATMFHSIIASQARFMRRELQIMWKGGDIKGIAQFAGTLGILFPAVMPWLQGLEVMGRTASPQKGMDEVKKDYSDLRMQNGFGNFTETYLSMLAHLGGFGVAQSIIKSAWGDRLASTVLGPAAGPVVTGASDFIKAATKPSTSTKHNPFSRNKGNPNQKWYALGRDVSELTIPIVGKWAGHKLFPTLAEQREGKPHFPNRRRRR